MDGAVYEWNVTSYKREGESVLKSCSYTSVAVSPDSRTTFAVGSDRTLKEICDSQVNTVHCVKLHSWTKKLLIDNFSWEPPVLL